MPYVARPGDRAGLVIGGLLAAGATAIALRHPALKEAVRFDVANAAFVLLAWAALATIGNALWIMTLERRTFPIRWWIVAAFFVSVFVGFGAWLAWPLPIVAVAFGAVVSSIGQILTLLEIPLGIAWLFVDARKYPSSESFRLVKPRP